VIEQKVKGLDLTEPRVRFKRNEILQILNSKIKAKKPVLIADAGIGLTAKMAESEGIDLITATSEGRIRMMGQPSCMSYMAVGNANDMALDALRRAARMARKTPVLCGIAPGDPYRDIEQLIAEAMAMGADGVITLPAANGFGSRLDRDVAGSILNSEADLRTIAYCRKNDIFSIGAAFDAEYAVKAAGAGCDLIVAHAGFTVGGLSGAPKESARSLEEVCTFTGEIVERVHKVCPDCIVVCHGACLNTPENVQACLTQSGAQGMFGGSVFDRIPIEEAVMDVVSHLEALPLRRIKEEVSR